MITHPMCIVLREAVQMRSAKPEVNAQKSVQVRIGLDAMEMLIS
jgi:hypothetical protein